ncbi:MAG: AAA domain-containing protein [Myxococcota bacterium]
MAHPSHPWLATLSRALSDAHRWERDEHARLLALPMADRIAAGISWPSLRFAGLDASSSWGGWMQIGLQPAARAALHDGVSAGDLVLVAPYGDPNRGVEGRCVDVAPDRATIRLFERKALPGWLEGGHVAVTRAIDDTTVRRYQQGLLRADHHRSPLRDALLDATLPTPDFTGAADLDGLNPAQQRAGAAALNADALAMIHGPPGTGKTTLMVGLLRALVARGERPWALADSNAAVDHLATRADAAGLRVLRLGSPYRIGPQARHLSMSAYRARSPLAPALRTLEAELSRADDRERRPLIRARRALLDQIRNDTLANSDVIAATLGTMSKEGGALPAVRTALIDEATQAVEPAIWSVVPWLERLILLGDPHQLGPVVKQPNNPLSRSVLERLLDRGGEAPMLETQYRMSTPLVRLLSHTYGPRYRAHPDVADHRLCDLNGVADVLLTRTAAMWVDTAGGGLEEARDPATMSLYNDGEVEVIVAATGALLRAGVNTDDIGVIAPYSAQVARIRERLPGVEVATVNAFQGREKEAILCSFVRSNPDGALGFVSDARRLTVAVSRARRLLFCVGDFATLSAAPAFQQVLDAMPPTSWASVWDPPWDIALPDR